MCRVCEFKEMSQDELGQVLRPIIAKVNLEATLTQREVNDLVAYGALLEGKLAGATAEVLAVKAVAASMLASALIGEAGPAVESTDELDEAAVQRLLRQVLDELDGQ